MAREIVTWCDPCLAQDERSPGREMVVRVENITRVMAMCGPHEDQYLKPLAALLEEYGVPAEAQPAPAPAKPAGAAQQRATALLTAAQVTGTRKGKTPAERGAHCLWCSLTYSSDGGGLGRHVRTIHGYDGVKEAYGRLCPLCGESYDILQAHLRKSHEEFGFGHLSQAFLWAKDNGDPFGAYEAAVNRQPSLDPEEEYARLNGKGEQGA